VNNRCSNRNSNVTPDRCSQNTREDKGKEQRELCEVRGQLQLMAASRASHTFIFTTQNQYQYDNRKSLEKGRS
jgi:hypothetical protein